MHTETEIFQQPDVWIKIFELVKGMSGSLSQFLSPILSDKNASILLTGAGSSAFIGEALQLPIARATGCRTTALPTTDLVTHPELTSQFSDNKLLVISFARSGNSPESVETVHLLNQGHQNIRHLFITCNKDGKLAKLTSVDSDKYYCLTLPEETNDKSLAMTSSFSSMLLAALLTFNIDKLDENRETMLKVSKISSTILEHRDIWKKIGSLAFGRAVFLGSGPLLGIANECHLKLQELSNGHVVCKHDSFLGFRHGPRAVVNEDTLIVYLLSHEEKTSKYEKDLADTISSDSGYLSAVHVGNVQYKNPKDYAIPFEKLEKDTLGLSILPYLIVGQLIGLYKSLNLGLNPDNPSTNGSISRVVKGVNIYK